MSSSRVLGAYNRLSIHLPSFDFFKGHIFHFHLLVFGWFTQNCVSNTVAHKPYLGMGKSDSVDVLNYSHPIHSSSSVIFITSQLRYSWGIKAEGKEFRWLEQQPPIQNKAINTFIISPVSQCLWNYSRKHCLTTCIKATFICSQVRAKWWLFCVALLAAVIYLGFRNKITESSLSTTR